MRMHVIGSIVRLIDPGESKHEKDPFKKARKQENSTYMMFHYCSF